MLVFFKGEALVRFATGFRGPFKIGSFAFRYSPKAGISKLFIFAEANNGLTFFYVILMKPSVLLLKYVWRPASSFDAILLANSVISSISWLCLSVWVTSLLRVKLFLIGKPEDI